MAVRGEIIIKKGKEKLYIDSTKCKVIGIEEFLGMIGKGKEEIKKELMQLLEDDREDKENPC